MGFFDILSPYLTIVDGLLSLYISDWLIMLFWGLLAALVSTVVFKKCSNPETISHLKKQLKAKQQELNDHDGEFSELKTLAAETMKLSLKRMLLTFFPAMLASIPVIFLLTHLSNRYDLKQPRPGDEVPINITWGSDNSTPDVLVIAQEKNVESEVHNHVNWPSGEEKVQLFDRGHDQTIVELPLPLSTVIHKKLWWNALIGNPAGYLDDASHVNHISFTFEKKQIIGFGPSWMRGWLTVFLFFTVSFSIVFMWIFKVKF